MGHLDLWFGFTAQRRCTGIMMSSFPFSGRNKKDPPTPPENQQHYLSRQVRANAIVNSRVRVNQTHQWVMRTDCIFGQPLSSVQFLSLPNQDGPTHDAGRIKLWLEADFCSHVASVQVLQFGSGPLHGVEALNASSLHCGRLN